eukprot:13288039-Heterocapsa_arctica.AAC.1
MVPPQPHHQPPSRHARRSSTCTPWTTRRTISSPHLARLARERLTACPVAGDGDPHSQLPASAASQCAAV